MLWAIAVVLVILWLLGYVSGYTESYFIHILPFFAVITILIQIEADCSDYGYVQMRKRHLGRRVAGRLGKILPKLSMTSGQQISQQNSSAKTYRD
jgi:hypothetical protein